MVDEYKIVAGNWLDAIGNIISAFAEIRTLAGINDINNQLVAVGEGLQAVGNALIGTVETGDLLDFAGNWIEGAGAAASSIGAQLQYIDPENGEDNIRLGILGDAFQSIGSAFGTLAEYKAEDAKKAFVIGNALQSLGAGLEAIGGVYELNEKEEQGQPITTIGAILQAAGANLNAITATKALKRKYIH